MNRFAVIAALSVVLLVLGTQTSHAQTGYPYPQTVMNDAPGPWLQASSVSNSYPPPPNGYGSPYSWRQNDQSFDSTYSLSDIFDSRGSAKPKLNAQLGLGLFEPRWSDESFKTLVPAAAAPAFGFTGKGRSDDFIYVPSLTVSFDFQGESPFGTLRPFSYTQLELVGKLNEDPMPGTTLPTYDTTSTITMREFRLQLAEWKFMQDRQDCNCTLDVVRGPVSENMKCFRVDDVPQFTFLLDASYRDLDQQYISTVRSGSSSSDLKSTANFKGLGIATVAKFRLPLFDAKERKPFIESVYEKDILIERTFRHIAPFALFFNVYGNFSVGKNERFSSLTVNAEAPGATDVSSQSRLDKTEFVATGGFDTGLEWNTVSNDKVISAIVAFTLENSSNIGPINPQAVVPSSNDFLLYGVLVAGGVSF